MSSPDREQSPLKDVLKTSLPAVVDLSSQTIAWLIEAIYIGNLSAAALAGVGFSLQIVILTFTVLLTFVVGASIIITRYLGAGNTWKANHVLAQALIIGTILSFLIAASWYFGGTQLLFMIKEEDASARLFGIEYLETLSYFGPLIIVNFIALGIMRMAGDTMLTMKVNLFANILHLSLAPLLIFGLWGFPRMETKGAALAVGIAHSLALFITLYYLRSRKGSLFLSLKEFTTPNFETFKKLFKLGIPTTVEQLVWALGQLILSFYASQVGIVVLAAHQVFVRIQSVLTMAFNGFGMASMTLVGKNIGAEDESAAIAAGNTTARVALISAILMSGVLILFKDVWLHIFTNDARVIELGTASILILAALQLPKAVNAVFTGNLRGGADLNWLMWLAIFSVIVFEGFASYFMTFTFHMSLFGLWLIQAIDEAFRTTLNIWRFRGRKWLLKTIL